MQQLNSILLAPMTAAKSAQSAGTNLKGADLEGGKARGAGVTSTYGNSPQAAQKFSFHISQLTEQLDKQTQQSDSTAGSAQTLLATTLPSADRQSKEAAAVSDLARTLLDSAEDEDLSADEAWLSMVEELNSMATGDLSLEEVSSRHGIDVAELETPLNQALIEFDGDMSALIAQLQQVSGGKALPPASGDTAQTLQNDQLTTAERNAVKDALAESGSSADGKGESIEALLQRVEALSPGQQTQFAASVNELMAQLSELEMSDLSAQNLQSLDDKTAQQLAKLRDMLQTQVHSLLDSDVELNPKQTTQLDSYLGLLHKLDQLPLQTIFSEPKSSQQIADDLAHQDLPGVAQEQRELNIARGEIAEVLHAMQALFSSALETNTQTKPEAWLQTVDLKTLQGDLDEMLNALDDELDGASRDQLMALLQTQLWALEELNQANSELQTSEPQGDNLTRLNQLLNELNQKLERVSADIRVIDASRHSEPGNALPPVAHALAQVSQQLRAQIQAALQLEQQQGGQLDDADAGDLDNLRRLLSESVASSTEPRNTTATANQALAGNQTGQQGNPGQAGAAHSNHMQRAAEQPAQSAFETARQAQQAIDILGTGASERLRERVSVMFNTRTQAAEMRLDPPDLGRLNIRLNMNQEQATVSFQVTTPQAREALEQSLPRLRELLAEQGIELADANVSEQQQDGSREASSGQGQFAAQDNAETDDSELQADGKLEVASEVAAADGRVDYFV